MFQKQSAFVPLPPLYTAPCSNRRLKKCTEIYLYMFTETTLGVPRYCADGIDTVPKQVRDDTENTREHLL